jgi:hypothetical protein
MAKSRRSLEERVADAAGRTLAAQKYVSAVDVLLGIGWLDPNSMRRWRLGQVDCLEQVMQVNPARIVEAMTLLGSWARENNLSPAETDHVARTPGRQALRFSLGGDARVEQLYRTRWVSPELPERKRERLAEKAREPELVAISPLHADWTCHRCGGSGPWLIMENGGPACLPCVGLGDLELLPAGDALLTRRAKARSARHAVLVRFSKTRKRYERRGLLVEPQAWRDAQREVEAERARAGSGRRRKGDV